MNKNNDWTLRNGTVTDNYNEFGADWIVDPNEQGSVGGLVLQWIRWGQGEATSFICSRRKLKSVS